jgi:hypothetical protein
MLKGMVARNLGLGEALVKTKRYQPRPNPASLEPTINPVKAGLVERAEDWRWGSARWYIRQQSVGVSISWID